jgi:hypothetical protein
MNTKRTRLLAGVLSAIALSAPVTVAAAPSLVFSNFRGTVHVLQGVPCNGVVDVTTSIADGRMEITPSAPGRESGGGVRFDLTRLDLLVTPFAVEDECLGTTATVEFHEIGYRLVGAVRVTGEPVGGSGDQYRFSIPKEQVLLFTSVLNNLPVKQPEMQYQRPSEDLTGEIDLRRGTARLHVVLSSELRFRLGCDARKGKKCLVDELLKGTQTADVTALIVTPSVDRDSDAVPDLADNCPLVPNRTQSPVATPVLSQPADVTVSACQPASIGTARALDVCHARPVVITNNAPASFTSGRNVVTWSANNGVDPIVTAEQIVTVGDADRTAPTLSCTAVRSPGGSFQVAAADECSDRTSLRLGSFELSSGEVIKIEQTGKPGVRLINKAGANGIRHFQVGKGEAIITATDAAGNVGRAACGQPVEVTTRR